MVYADSGGVLCMQIPYDSPWVQVFGRLHIVVLHFPIALVAVAALLVLWSMIRRQSEDAPRQFSPGLWLVGIAAVSAALAAVTGWVFAGAEYADTKGSLGLHRWLGVASAVLVVAAYVAGIIASKFSSTRASRLYIAIVLLAAPLVGFTGHVGGGLVHGKDFVFQPLLKAQRVEEPAKQQPPTQPLDQLGFEEEADESSEPPLLTGPSVEIEEPADPIPAMTVSFEDDVMPILQESCVSCHREGKSRGRVRLDDLEHVLQTVERGKPDESLLVYPIELPESDPDSMPLDRPSLPDEQIAIIRAWVASLEAE